MSLPEELEDLEGPEPPVQQPVDVPDTLFEVK